MAKWHPTFGLVPAILASFVLVAAGCATKAPKTAQDKQNLEREGEAAMSDLRQADASIDDFLKRAYGYVIFPSVGKGGFIVGGAHGKGEVYEQGRFVGYSDLSQASVGFLAGGQTFRELIVFGTKEAMENFKTGQMSIGADVGVVALKTGAAASAQFKNGIAVFVKPIGGAMLDVSVAGQRLSFRASDRM